GDFIKGDDTIVEISTDKVDIELPSPASGTVTEILVDEDETVTVGQVIARISLDGTPPGAADGNGARATAPSESAPSPVESEPTVPAPAPTPAPDVAAAPAPADAPAPDVAASPAPADAPAPDL